MHYAVNKYNNFYEIETVLKQAVKAAICTHFFYYENRLNGLFVELSFLAKRGDTSTLKPANWDAIMSRAST